MELEPHELLMRLMEHFHGQEANPPHITWGIQEDVPLKLVDPDLERDLLAYLNNRSAAR
jgi:hypothetical protein